MKKLLFPLITLLAVLLTIPASASDGSATMGAPQILGVLVGALLFGILVALLIVFLMKRSMSTVRKQKRADGYIQSGSFKLTESRDIFLYSTVTRIRINTNKRK